MSVDISLKEWMTADMGLSGNELTVFAYIYGMCQSDIVSRKSVSVADIKTFLHISDRSVTRNITSLLDKGYIQCRKNGNSKAYLYFPSPNIVADHISHDGFDFGKPKKKHKLQNKPTLHDYEFAIDDFCRQYLDNNQVICSNIKEWIPKFLKLHKDYSIDNLVSDLHDFRDDYKSTSEQELKSKQCAKYGNWYLPNNYKKDTTKDPKQFCTGWDDDDMQHKFDNFGV